MKVLQATELFGSEVRLRLVKHFLEHPGSQVSAVEALGLNSGTVTRNTQALVALGVIKEGLDPQNRRARHYSVRLSRYRELLQALHDYVDDETDRS